jgi:hypothetical protein
VNHSLLFCRQIEQVIHSRLQLDLAICNFMVDHFTAPGVKSELRAGVSISP